MEESNKQAKAQILESLITYYQTKKQEEEVKYRQYTEQLSKLSQQYEDLRVARETVRGAYTAFEQARRDVEQQLKTLNNNEEVIDGQVTVEDIPTNNVISETFNSDNKQEHVEDISTPESDKPETSTVKEDIVKAIDTEQVTKAIKEDISEQEKQVVQQTVQQTKKDEIPDYLK